MRVKIEDRVSGFVFKVESDNVNGLGKDLALSVVGWGFGDWGVGGLGSGLRV